LLFPFFSKKFIIILIIYLFNTLLYTKFLKNFSVIEMFMVAFGFVIRLISGALVLDLPISEWFLIVGGFAALFVVSAKRLAELKQSNDRHVRKVIHAYTTDFLNSSMTISVAVCVTAYSFWAFTQILDPFWYQLSVLPFVMAFFRYRWMSELDVVEVPEDAILGDRSLLLASLGTILCLSIAIY
jgi:decaprenyl-phosphate phosphoribosyltransferase